MKSRPISLRNRELRNGFIGSSTERHAYQSNARHLQRMFRLCIVAQKWTYVVDVSRLWMSRSTFRIIRRRDGFFRFFFAEDDVDHCGQGPLAF